MPKTGAIPLSTSSSGLAHSLLTRAVVYRSVAKRPIKVGVALSGGSAWGVAHVGVLAALLKHDIPIDCIAGTSAGSVAAAPFAFGVPIEKIEEAAKKLEWKQISRFAYSRLGVRSNASLAHVIRDLVGDSKIEDAKIPLAIVATDIENGEQKVFYEGDVAQAVCASSAIPGYFAPIQVDGKLYVDGAVTENLPRSPLTKFGADFTIGVLLAGMAQEYRPKNIGEVVARSFEILFGLRDRELRQSFDVLIEPNLHSFHPRSFAEAEAMYQAGFRAAETAIPAIKTKLAPKDTERPDFFKRVRDFLTERLA